MVPLYPTTNTHLRPLFILQIERIPHGPGLGFGHGSLHELVIGFVLHKDPRAGTAALTHVEEQSEMTRLHSVIHWRWGRLLDRGRDTQTG